MKHRFVQHFCASFSIVLIAAWVCAYLQNTLSIDHVGILVFLFLTIVGLIFSVAFALFQKWLQQSVRSTAILVLILSVYLVTFSYLFHKIYMDWHAVSEGQIQLTLLQNIIRSNYSFWLAYLIPFSISFLYTYHKTKAEFG